MHYKLIFTIDVIANINWFEYTIRIMLYSPLKRPGSEDAFKLNNLVMQMMA
jgi:hypothetical protein